MSSVITQQAAAGRTEGTLNRRAEALATRLDQGAQALAALASTLTDAEWQTGVTMADVHAMNANHAKEHEAVTKATAIALLQSHSAVASAAIRALTDQQLDNAAPASLYDGAPITCQFMLEDHAVRHSYHHLAGIRAALKR